MKRFGRDDNTFAGADAVDADPFVGASDLFLGEEEEAVGAV